MSKFFDKFLNKLGNDFNNIINENIDNSINSTNNVNNEIEKTEELNNNSNLVSSNRKEVLQNLLIEDNTFSEAKFKSKVDNVFIKLYTSVMKQDLEKVKHFISNNVYEEFMNRIKKSQEKNEIQMYDELNVSNTNIESIQEYDDRFEINVSLLTKYLDYRITRDTRKFISGDRDVRKEKNVRLKFSKIKNAKSQGNARKCPGCGANIDVNKSGICVYCGSVYTLREYDWVLEEIYD